MGPLEIFKNDVSPALLASIYEKVCSAYSSSRFSVDSQPIGEDEKYNLIPWTRCAHVESRVRDAALEHKTSVVTEETGFWRHVVITCGRIRLTQSSTKDQETPLRAAGYKMKYAAEQLYLPGLEELAPKLKSTDAHLYAVLMHHAPSDANSPDFVVVRFPLADLTGFHPGVIDLALYGGLPQSEPAIDIEAIADLAVPRLKSKRIADNS